MLQRFANSTSVSTYHLVITKWFVSKRSKIKSNISRNCLPNSASVIIGSNADQDAAAPCCMLPSCLTDWNLVGYILVLNQNLMLHYDFDRT